MWKELIEVLREITSNYYQLLELSKRKKAVIIAVNIDDLNEIVKDEQKMIQSIAVLERKRQKITVGLVEAKLIPSTDLNLETMVSYCDNASAAILNKFHLALKQIALHLKELNQQNAKLVDQSLSLVEYQINLLSQAEVDPIYQGKTAGGSRQGENVINRNLFDQKI